MHGRLKSAQLRDSKSLAALERRAVQYRNAEAALWALHKQRKIPCSGEHAQGVVNSTENDEEEIHPPSSEDFLAASSKLVKVNPDLYTVWNWRREELLLTEQLSKETETLVVRELELSKAGIEKNPKSYPAWFHRRWMIEWGGPHIGDESRLGDILKNELELCTLLLKISEQLALSTKEEFCFITEKMKENFSNYSAFHRRSQLLSALALEREADGTMDARCELLSEELQLARTAYFTEPDDQSVWWYIRFLVCWANSSIEGEGVQLVEKVESRKLLTPKLRAVLEEEVQAIKELLEFEPRSKWARISLVDILGKLGRVEEAVILCRELVEIDPGHSMHYHYLMQKWQQ